MEGVLGQQRRWELGAHYTHEVDIMKIVGPTIVRPGGSGSRRPPRPGRRRALLDELCRSRCSTPPVAAATSCTSPIANCVPSNTSSSSASNVSSATRAVRRRGTEPYYPLTNLQGIDIERSAVEIAKVTLWMGHRQMMERYGEAEPPLPLLNLPGLGAADALRTAGRRRTRSSETRRFSGLDSSGALR